MLAGLPGDPAKPLTRASRKSVMIHLMTVARI
jgi:hypothetical protein